jgi:farnesyl-diphosphate farnesyltransferase
MGLATLELLLRNESWLDPGRPSKVSRGWVYRTLALSMVAAPSNTILRAWIARLSGRVERGIAVPVAISSGTRRSSSARP